MPAERLIDTARYTRPPATPEDALTKAACGTNAVFLLTAIIGNAERMHAPQSKVLSMTRTRDRLGRAVSAETKKTAFGVQPAVWFAPDAARRRLSQLLVSGDQIMHVFPPERENPARGKPLLGNVRHRHGVDSETLNRAFLDLSLRMFFGWDWKVNERNPLLLEIAVDVDHEPLPLPAGGASVLPGPWAGSALVH